MSESRDDERLRMRLTSLLNEEGRENVSDTPDFILARVMMDALVAFERATSQRERWWRIERKTGRTPSPGQVEEPDVWHANEDGHFVRKDDA